MLVNFTIHLPRLLMYPPWYIIHEPVQLIQPPSYRWWLNLSFFLSFSAMICWICPFLLWYFDLIGGFNPPVKIWKSDWIIIPTIGEVIKFHGSKPPTSDGWEAMIWILPWHSLAFNSQEAHDIPVILIGWIQVDTIPCFKTSFRIRHIQQSYRRKWLVCRWCIHILSNNAGFHGYHKFPEAISWIS